MRVSISNARGSALVLVLWVSFGLVSLAIYFGHGMSMELKAASNSEAGVQAEQAIEGAVRYVKYLLANLPSQGRLPEPDLYVTEAAEVGEAFFWITGRDPAAVDMTRPYFELIDESGKLNLNTALYTNLMELPFMTVELADAIIDWRDADDEPRSSGAESDVYLRYNPPMYAKNAPFESIEELRMLNGATEELLYGEDANGNGILDPNEDDGDASPPSDNADGRLDFGIMEYVTVWSREGNLQTNGEPRLILPALAGTQGSQAALTAIQGWFTTNLTEDRFNTLRPALTQATNLVDLYIRSGNTLDEFAEYDDVLTMSTNAIEGLVNVNTASAAVLNTLPGVEVNDAESLVAYRDTNPSALRSVAWITEVLGQDVARRLGGLITDKGFQYMADISAVGRGGRGYRRSRMVFDISEDHPKIVHRRDDSRSGWALGVETREALLALRGQQ
ncbi:MAG: general secretion pathway protein GspK [Verrucomicrobiae bacterium]|nr:general secretion pathway protein GspK [Verrucomicrobiae bacterium]